MYVCNANSLKEMPRVEALIFENYLRIKQAFSCMSIIRSKVRSQLANENLESCLKLKTSYEPNL